MVKLECLYCGCQFIHRPYYDYNDDPRCPECKDKNLRQIKDDKSDIFGYNETE